MIILITEENFIKMIDQNKILILTPMKDAEAHLDIYFQGLERLNYPKELFSIGILEGDSSDHTYRALQKRLPQLQQQFQNATILQKDFGFKLPKDTYRWDTHIQIQRRANIAKSRNYLLFSALTDEDWVLWLDVDVTEYPLDTIEQLLATGKDIVHPNCVKQYGGASYDQNAWYDKGKRHLHDLRKEGTLARLHSVGGTMLLIRADLHREGLIFPTFLYGKKNRLIRRSNGFYPQKKWFSYWMNRLRGKYCGEIETEGLGVMAYDMGYECWGMPNLEIRHRDG